MDGIGSGLSASRAPIKIGLLNLTYNMKRLVQLTAIEPSAGPPGDGPGRDHCARYGLKEGEYPTKGLPFA